MIRVLAVDDEHFALALLENYIGRLPYLSLAGLCRSAVRAVEILQSEPIDLLLLDVQMPVLSGTGLLRSVSKRPVTIFTTAHPQHAVEAFDLDAVDYLLKPFSFERFERAVHKARELLENRRPGGSKPEGILQVKADRRLVKIPFIDILYIEGWKEYVKIYTLQDKLITLESLNNLENILPESHFLRVHKSYIVARAQVIQFEADQLLLTGGATIPVARARKREVIENLFGGS